MHRIAIALGIALMLSLIGNWWQHDSRASLRTKVEACIEQRKVLVARQKVLETENSTARAAAKTKAATHEARADAVLATPASNADSCVAANERVTAWLKSR